jgi:hypothetical protein
MRRLAAVSLLLLSCGPSDAQRAEDAKASALRSRMDRVQAAACLRPAERRDCEEGARIDFEGRTHPVEIGAAPRHEPSGSIWCENGVAHGRFAGFPADKGAVVEGIVGQAVWEALWRVAEASEGCIGAYRGSVTVTRQGTPRSCPAPELDMEALVTRAYWWARQKAPRIAKRCRTGPDDICEINPCACQSSMPRAPGAPPPKCAPYDGDE